MKQHRIIFLLLFALAILPVQAQDFEQKLARAEQVKAKKGETSEKYLDALSEAIQAAFGAEDYETANKYRLVHADIVKQKYGENSLEYAEDLWRLGNVSSYKGTDYTFTCYSRAAQIYESLNATSEFPYCNILWNIFLHYNNANNLSESLSYIEKTIAFSSQWVGKEWKGNTVSNIELCHYYLNLALLQEQNNDEKGYLSSLEQCDHILTQNNLRYSYNYSDEVYARLADYYSNVGDFDNGVENQLIFSSIAKEKYGPLSQGYYNSLSVLHALQYNNNDISAAINTVKKKIDIDKQVISSENIPASDDSLFIKDLSLLIAFGNIARDYNQVIKTGEELRAIYKSANKITTEEYWDVLDDLLDGYSKTGRSEDWFKVCNEYLDILNDNNLHKSERFYSILSLKVENLMLSYRWDEYRPAYEEYVTLTKEMFGDNSYEHLLLAFQTANSLNALDREQEAKTELKGVFDILQSGAKLFDNAQDSLLVMSHIHNLEGSILQSENDRKAETILKLAIEEGKASGNEIEAAYVNLGVYYEVNAKKHQEALACFQQARDIIMEKGDTTSLNYYSVLNNIGLCYQSLGQYNLAMNAFDEAAYNVLNIHGKQHPAYAMTIQNKSMFYAYITDYLSAAKFGEEALELMGNVYGVESERYAVCLQNLGMYYTELGKYSESEECLLKSIDIFCNLNSANSIYLIYPYVNLLSVYGMQQKFDKLNEVDAICRQILIDNDLQTSTDAVGYYGSLGYILAINNNPDAKKYIAEVISILEKLGLEDSMDYLNGALYYAFACYIDGVPEENVVKYLAQEYRNRYISTFAYFNHDERESLISGARFNQFKNVLFSASYDDSYNTSLYDFILFNKGLLLGTSISYAKAVHNSGNDELIEKYHRLVEMNRTITSTAMDNESAVLEMKKQASVLEREITSELQNTSNYVSNLDISYADITNALSTKDLAIEYVLYQDYRDTEKYVALVAKKGWESPKFIPLGDKTEVDKLLSNRPSQLYSEGYVSSELYKILWAPIEEFISVGDNIYFSPDGRLYQFAIEQLCDETGKHLCEKYNMIRCSSTKAVCNKQIDKPYKNAILYGGLRYDEDDTTMLAASRNYSISTDNSNGFFEDNMSTTRKGWQYLPGTLIEVNNVSSLLEKARVKNRVYAEEAGNEESFKALSGDNISILHVATHGFYITESEAEKHTFAITNPFSQTSTASSVSSMNRSGLLMSGGNKAWLGGSAPDGVEDGVLTANEIADLNFNSVDLLVLSACETGLGEITNEGVLGLQRAFKNAGVETIIMSLWEVDDQATSLMMETFYKNLVTGKSKRESFVNAQKAVRVKYDDPSYWAAFIMLD